MATDVTPVALGPPVPAAGDRERRARCAREAPTGNATVIAVIKRRLNIALPAINAVCAAITYVFVTYIVPLPGTAPPASLRTDGLVATIAGFAVCWVLCAALGRR